MEGSRDDYLFRMNAQNLFFFQLLKLNKYWSGGWTSSCAPGTRFSKAPITNGPVKLLLFTCNCRGLKRFAANMIKLSVSETQWSSLLARTRALIRYISNWIFDFGPEKLPGLSRNRPQVIKKSPKWIICGSTRCIPLRAATATECDKKSKRAWKLLKFSIHVLNREINIF